MIIKQVSKQYLSVKFIKLNGIFSKVRDREVIFVYYIKKKVVKKMLLLKENRFKLNIQ